jgi:hypothetical protein
VRVRRILSVLLEALGRPIGHGCWVDPMMRGSGDALGGEEVERLHKYRGSAQLGTTVVGKDGVSGTAAFSRGIVARSIYVSSGRHDASGRYDTSPLSTLNGWIESA